MSEIVGLSSLLRSDAQQRLDISEMFYIDAARWTRRLAVKFVATKTFYFRCSKPIISTRERCHFQRSKPLKITGIVGSADCGPPTEVRRSISNELLKTGIVFHLVTRSCSYFGSSRYVGVSQKTGQFLSSAMETIFRFCLR